MPDLPTLLILEDISDQMSPLALFLSESFNIKVASRIEDALGILGTKPKPALVLLNNGCCGMQWPQVMSRLRGESELDSLPLVCLSASPTDAEHESALVNGATDYIGQPVNIGVLKARLKSHIKANDALRLKLFDLSEEIAKKELDLLQIQDVAATAMASMAELRDPDTVNHIRRTQHYVRTLARKLSSHPKYNTALTLSYISTLFKAAPLHDIGKAGIPDRVLLKPGRLTPEETEIMRTHTTLGRDIIESAEKSLNLSSPFFSVAKEIAYSHHEKWDGTGYPLGLAEEGIPLSARLMALADVYDALITRRSYKEPMSHESAVEIIQSSSGRHFDPNVVNAFLEVSAGFKTIAIAHSDGVLDVKKKAEYKAIVYPTFRD